MYVLAVAAKHKYGASAVNNMLCTMTQFVSRRFLDTYGYLFVLMGVCADNISGVVIAWQMANLL